MIRARSKGDGKPNSPEPISALLDVARPRWQSRGHQRTYARANIGATHRPEGGSYTLRAFPLCVPTILYGTVEGIDLRRLRSSFALIEAAAIEQVGLRRKTNRRGFLSRDEGIAIVAKLTKRSAVAATSDLEFWESIGWVRFDPARGIRFAESARDMRLADVNFEPIVERVRALTEGQTRNVPILRRWLRALARWGERVTCAVLVATHVRVAFIRNRRFLPTGRCAVVHVVNAFGVSRRAVQDERKRLIEEGALVIPDTTDSKVATHWKEWGNGKEFTLNTEFDPVAALAKRFNEPLQTAPHPRANCTPKIPFTLPSEDCTSNTKPASPDGMVRNQDSSKGKRWRLRASIETLRDADASRRFGWKGHPTLFRLPTDEEAAEILIQACAEETVRRFRTGTVREPGGYFVKLMRNFGQTIKDPEIWRAARTRLERAKRDPHPDELGIASVSGLLTRKRGPDPEFLRAVAERNGTTFNPSATTTPREETTANEWNAERTKAIALQGVTKLLRDAEAESFEHARKLCSMVSEATLRAAWDCLERERATTQPAPEPEPQAEAGELQPLVGSVPAREFAAIVAAECRELRKVGKNALQPLGRAQRSGSAPVRPGGRSRLVRDLCVSIDHPGEDSREAYLYRVVRDGRRLDFAWGSRGGQPPPPYLRGLLEKAPWEWLELLAAGRVELREMPDGSLFLASTRAAVA